MAFGPPTRLLMDLGLRGEDACAETWCCELDQDVDTFRETKPASIEPNFSGSLHERCDSTDLRKELRLVADGMC
jgi:hypothetical protein